MASEKINYVFEDGVKFSGTMEQLTKVAAALGKKINDKKLPVPRGFYRSESKGLVRISEMNEYHLRQALVKRTKDYVSEIFNAKEPVKSFLAKYTGLTEDQVVSDMFMELQKRS